MKELSLIFAYQYIPSVHIRFNTQQVLNKYLSKEHIKLKMNKSLRKVDILFDKDSVLVSQSCPTLCDPMDYVCQAPLSTEFSRREYWSGQPFPSPGDLPDPGIKPRSPALQAGSLPSEPRGRPQRMIHAYVQGLPLEDQGKKVRKQNIEH